MDEPSYLVVRSHMLGGGVHSAASLLELAHIPTQRQETGTQARDEALDSCMHVVSQSTVPPCTDQRTSRMLSCPISKCRVLQSLREDRSPSLNYA